MRIFETIPMVVSECSLLFWLGDNLIFMWLFMTSNPVVYYSKVNVSLLHRKVHEAWDEKQG